LPVEGTVEFLLGHAALSLVEHLHVTTERNGSQDVLCAVATNPAPQRAAEPDGETQHTHSATARDPEMTELVDRDEDAQGEQGDQNGLQEFHGGHIPGSAEQPACDASGLGIDRFDMLK
jgi:hypothetical protein